MNCEPVHRVLDADLDGELDEATHAQVQTHVMGCAACAQRKADRDALRNGLRRLPRHEMPAHLQGAVRRALASKAEVVATVPARRVQRWHVAAWVGMAAALSFCLGLWVATPASTRALSEQVIARHVASFDDGAPRVQVQSTDRHVVKPWFAGKLDFAPPVRDLSEHGFVLIGGRVDTLAGQPAAVIVYRIRQHQISLFVTRTQPAASSAASLAASRGFAIATWAQDGLAFQAISDLDSGELRRFMDKVQMPA